MDNHLKIVIALLITCSAQLAKADAKNFEGFSAQAGTGYQSYSLESSNYLNNGTDANLKAEGATLGGVPAMLALAYSAAINESWTLGAALEHNPLGSGKKTSIIRNSNSNAEVGSNTIKTTSHTALSLVPGFAIDKETLVYAKLGYVWLRTKGVLNDGSPADNDSLSGYQLGLGVKKMLDANFFGFAEANYIDLQSKNVRSASTQTLTYKESGSGYTLLFGMGYQF